MKNYKLIITPLAQQDIDLILGYLDGFGRDVALQYFEYIDEAINSLSSMPERCSLVRCTSLKEKGYRWLSVRNYTIFFIIDVDIVRIERVLYSKREYDVIL